MSEQEKRDFFRYAGISDAMANEFIAIAARRIAEGRTRPAERSLPLYLTDLVNDLIRVVGEPMAANHIRSVIAMAKAQFAVQPDIAPRIPGALKTVSIEDNVKVTKYHPTTSPPPSAQRAKRSGA